LQKGENKNVGESVSKAEISSEPFGGKLPRNRSQRSRKRGVGEARTDRAGEEDEKDYLLQRTIQGGQEKLGGEEQDRRDLYAPTNESVIA